MMTTTPTATPQLRQPDITRPNLARITLATHRGLRFRPLANYFFASSLMLTDVLAVELAQAALNYPLAFLQNGENVDLVALLSLTPGRNLYISDTGAWLSDFVPASICTYPFQYRPANEGGKPALFADMDSGLFDPDEGELLFNEAGKPSDKAKEIVRVLQNLERTKRVTRKIASQLSRYKLLVPWGQGSDEEPLRNLLRVDEAALNRLPQGDFFMLRQVGALPLAYAHLLSLALLPRLTNLARIHAATENKRRQLLDSCFQLGEDLGDTLRF